MTAMRSVPVRMIEIATQMVKPNWRRCGSCGEVSTDGYCMECEASREIVHCAACDCVIPLARIYPDYCWRCGVVCWGCALFHQCEELNEWQA